ncbi:MAG: Gfo/Idh/MocA family oxidoreductase [Clostridiales Family XIII bacterium]|nr:Gfo/Idh/MocA family oxidoreductase [Clostridiales Family XIII bacterium]
MKIGILGAGNIATKMAATLNAMNSAGENFEAYAVASRSLDKAKEFAEKNKISKFYGNYEELAADREVDLIYVATPHSHHFEHGRLCLEAGKPVLIEKAFAGNARQARALVEISQRKKIFLAEAIWTRYLPIRAVTEKILESGAIGKIFSLTTSLSYKLTHVERMQKPELAGGALLDLGVYVINSALMAFGEPISVESSVEMFENYGVDKNVSMVMSFKGGETAVLFCDLDEALGRQVTIVGSSGILVLDDVNSSQEAKIFLHNGESKTYKASFDINGFEYEIRACADAIISGAIEPKQMPHAETIRVMEIMDGIREKAGIHYPFD